MMSHSKKNSQHVAEQATLQTEQVRLQTITETLRYLSSVPNMHGHSLRYQLESKLKIKPYVAWESWEKAGNEKDSIFSYLFVAFFISTKEQTFAAINKNEIQAHKFAKVFESFAVSVEALIDTLGNASHIHSGSSIVSNAWDKHHTIRVYHILKEAQSKGIFPSHEG